MRLDPNRVLSKATIDAMIDLFAPTQAPSVDDTALLKVALGVADEPTRMECAEAVLASPDLLARLLSAEARAFAAFERRSASVQEAEDLGLLGAFPGPFSYADVDAVFPDRFAAARLDALAERGWLALSLDDRFAVAEGVRADLGTPAQAWEGDGAMRFARRYAEVAARVERIVSEGRWQDGVRAFQAELPNLRLGWTLALEGRAIEEAKSYVRSLLPTAMGIGDAATFAELVGVGYAAATDDARLRAWVLSFEGAAAARGADSRRARELWTERLAICRREGFRVAEADTLLDLAGESQTEGDHVACAALLAEAERIVTEIGHADYLATIWSHRALLCLAEEDVAGADEAAQRSKEILVGTEGENAGLFVRLTVARTLLRCGKPREAVEAFADALARSLESGRPTSAAQALSGLAEALESQGRVGIAAHCLTVSLGVHRRIGTRRRDAAASELAAFLERHPEAASEAREDEWERGGREILHRILSDTESSVPR